MNKISTLFLISIVGIALIGTSYALWSNTITLTGMVTTGIVDKKIDYISCKDTGLDPGPNGIVYAKDVADCTTTVDVDRYGGSVIFNNVYPGYAPDVDIKETNVGTIPVTINDVYLAWTCIDPGEGDVCVQVIFDKTCTSIPCELITPEAEIEFLDVFGEQLYPGQSITESITIRILQNAPQGAKYKLWVKERAVQFNEYPAP